MKKLISRSCFTRTMVPLTLCAIALIGTASASDYTSQVDGNWNDPTTWTPNGVPTSNYDEAYIFNNVVVDDTESAGYIGIDANILTVQPTGILSCSETVLAPDGTLEISTGGSFSTTMISNGGTLNLGDTVDFDAPIYTFGGSLRVEVDSAGIATLSGAIRDFGLGGFSGITKTGSGTLIVSGSNSYSGGTEIAGGTLVAENDTALGSGAATVDPGASLELTGGITVSNAITISGAGVDGAGAIFSGDYGNINTCSGTVTLAGDASIACQSSYVGQLFMTGEIDLNVHQLSITGSQENADVILQDDITGSGNVVIQQGATVVMQGSLANSYTGTTTVQAGGTLLLFKSADTTAIPGDLIDAGFVSDQSSGQLSSTTVVTLVGSGIFDLFSPGMTETAGGLVSTSGATQVQGVSLFDPQSSTRTLVLEGAGNYDYAGLIIDSPEFVPSTTTIVKQGTGSQEFDGTNTYRGGTTLNSGVLIAGNTSAFGTGLLKVNGGTVMMGNNNHTLTVGSYTQTGGTLYLQVNGSGQGATADQLIVANSTKSQVALGGNLTVDLTGFTNPAPHGTPASYTFDLLASESGYMGTFSSFDVIDSVSGLMASLSYTGDDVLLHLSGLLPSSGLTPNQKAILSAIDASLSRVHVAPQLTALVSALTPYSSNPTAFGAALDQLSPQAFGQFTSATAFNNASFETQALDTYLESQRSADGNFLAGHNAIDSSGFTANDPSYDPNLSMVHSRLLAWNPAPFDGTISDIEDALLGGIDMKDSKGGTAPAVAENPWNFFVRGNVVLAQGFSGEDTSHFDDNTESVVLGADCRLTPHFLVGLTAGYAHTDVTLDDSGSSATVDSYSPGIYASYADQGWYANLSADYLHNAYTQDRVIGFLDQTAGSSPQGNEGVANLDGGYDFHQGALTFGPIAGLQYTHLSVDGYKESGSIAALTVGNDESDSLRSRFGGRISYAFSHRGIKFSPHLDATWQHEFLDQSRGITSQFDFGGGSFAVRTVNPSRDSALVDAGLDADLNRTVTVFADYVVQAGQENYFGQSVQAGVKVGF